MEADTSQRLVDVLYAPYVHCGADARAVPDDAKKSNMRIGKRSRF
jgi:hypothetical protein